MAIGNRRPIHPGEILRELYLEPLGMSAGKLARSLNVPRTRIERLVKEQTAVTPDTALRLGKFFKSTPEMWMNMQIGFDLNVHRKEIQAALDDIKTVETANDNVGDAANRVRA